MRHHHSPNIHKFLYPTLLLCCLFTLMNTSYSRNLDDDCSVAFEYKVYEGNLPNVGGIIFNNQSTGSFSDLSWDFGDGNYSSSMSDSVTHFYEEAGAYNVTLTIWNALQDCYEQQTKIVEVVISNEDCVQTDCVYPGDANADDKADLLDLLHIGMGYGITGPARPNASYEWNGQTSPDWDENTPDGINYKHLDCNGDGVINEIDLLPVLYNYSAMEQEYEDLESGGPDIYLQFDTDTIYIDETTPDLLTISAGVMIGDADEPLEDIHGLALRLGYDSLYVHPQGVSVDYNQNSFLGDENTVIPYGQDRRNDEQLDLAFTRKGMNNISGTGRLATINYVIIIDIIGGRTENQTHFTVPIKGVKVIDVNGAEVDVNLHSEPASVLFISNITNTKDPLLSDLVNVFPNPATKEVNIDLGSLNGKYMELYNATGQLVYEAEVQNTLTKINTETLYSGIYLLKIAAEEGTLTKRLIITP